MTDTEQEAEVTITIPVKEAAQRHIEHLQATLTKRNEQIEWLTERLAEAEAGEPNRAALAREFKRGWQAAASCLMDGTTKAARALGEIRKDAYDLYLQAERRDWKADT